MTDATIGAPAPKKRSLFKRAAWQDAAKKENEDIFSHSNEFKDIIAEENRTKEEEKRKQAEAKRKAEAEERREQAEKQDKKGKRRKVSIDHDEPQLLRSGSSDLGITSTSQSQERSKTSHSPAAPALPPNSLTARYDTVARSTRSQGLRAAPVIVDLGGSDDEEDVYHSNSFGGNTWDDTTSGVEKNHRVALRPSKATPLDVDDLEEVQDPELAAIEARARARAAAKRAAAANGSKAPVAQLLIDSELPNTNPLMVKVRIDTTIEKPREAWCARQNFSPEMTRNVFFTWRGTRLYDSTTIKRLGIKIDDHGNLSLEGDDSIYDDHTTPKIHVEAWTDETLAQHKRAAAAEAEAARKAVEATPVAEARTPTPTPEPEAKKYRLFLKAKGLEDFKLQVRPDTTLERLADAFRTARSVPASQPLTLMFDGERLSPMDTIEDTELEDMDSIDVLLK
ncbi:ubiquitin-2 like Rad60 SUMO-like-domain-containing protein [Boeremia exigua]|uniref:ubiquitin-2 like Rad60 SUMO-like-domain-containing protein n=1 Tax=Boeremia exigua TaxID=749465 RepID=UPI001E8E895A|nr:ubiquitin-2 like Rad60 SUMO-like-domain-containing protein [Boeremia exigua]KAH6612528.1 ubiquitin-2 like Rad60 SUMO-like-domain-containing protein [Boeremia exigua]